MELEMIDFTSKWNLGSCSIAIRETFCWF